MVVSEQVSHFSARTDKQVKAQWQTAALPEVTPPYFSSIFITVANGSALTK